ncbi:hypothetical protein J2X02_003834 [Pseudoxanthomonas japonensis]|nr:hypothetical protein [Pseudoxanthomonas japonensis]
MTPHPDQSMPQPTGAGLPERQSEMTDPNPAENDYAKTANCALAKPVRCR